MMFEFIDEYKGQPMKERIVENLRLEYIKVITENEKVPIIIDDNVEYWIPTKWIDIDNIKVEQDKRIGKLTLITPLKDECSKDFLKDVKNVQIHWNRIQKQFFFDKEVNK